MQSGSVQYCPVMNGIQFRPSVKLLILNLLRVFYFSGLQIGIQVSKRTELVAPGAKVMQQARKGVL